MPADKCLIDRRIVNTVPKKHLCRNLGGDYPAVLRNVSMKWDQEKRSFSACIPS